MAKFKYVAGVTSSGKPVLQEVKVGTGLGQCARGEGLCTEHPTVSQWEILGGAKSGLVATISDSALIDDENTVTLTEYNKDSHECSFPSRGSSFSCKECGKSYYSDTAGEGGASYWFENKSAGTHDCRQPTTMLKKVGTEWTCKECNKEWRVTVLSYGGEGGGSDKVWREQGAL